VAGGFTRFYRTRLPAASARIGGMTDAALDPHAFETHRHEVVEGLTLAYVREGIGGFPLLLVHGYPETKRIWWRNIGTLAAAGFEVIAPDLRGFGDSDVAPDGRYDPAAFAGDLHALVRDHLGHDRCGVVAGDLGGVVAMDLGLRYPGFVAKQCLFNSNAPVLPEQYAAAGIPPDPDRRRRPTADYFLRQGLDADGLLAELDTPERRRAYIADFYGHRLWASPGSFGPDDVAFMTEPFADPAKLRASWGCYEVALGQRPVPEIPRLFEVSAIPTLALWGPDDHVVAPTWPEKCAVAFSECIGPFTVAGSGHFFMWEQAGILNRSLTHFFGDLLAER
jgi:pimeloyl-ACP methyl ester carboxylesterase